MTIIRRLEVFARPRVAPGIFWHGTSSKFLRSIMLHGLNPSKIKEGNWLVDPNVNQINPSKVSYGGIYYAKSAYTAHTYASQICQKDKSGASHPLLIAVQLAEQSALPDEDRTDFNPLVLEMLGRSEITAAEVLVRILLRTERRWYGGQYSWRDTVQQFRDLIFKRLQITPADITKRKDSAKFLGAIDALLLAGARRYLAHVQATRKSYENGYYYIKRALRDWAPKLEQKWAYETPDGYRDVRLPVKFRLPSPQQAEQDFIRSADHLNKMVKNYVRRKQLGDDGFWRDNRTLRILDKVGFRGRNKIICIMEWPDENGWHNKDRKGYTLIRVHYGKVPAEFLPVWRDRWSETMPVIFEDKNGKRLSVDDPKGRLDYTVVGRLTV